MAQVFDLVGEAGEGAVGDRAVAAGVGGHSPGAVGEGALEACRQGVATVEDVSRRDIEESPPGLAVNTFQGEKEAQRETGVYRSQVLPDGTLPCPAIHGRAGPKNNRTAAENVVVKTQAGRERKREAEADAARDRQPLAQPDGILYIEIKASGRRIVRQDVLVRELDARQEALTAGGQREVV